jgi:hypothetical protein
VEAVSLLAGVRKALALLSVLSGIALSLVVVGASPAGASSESYDFLSRVNASRQAHGLRSLTMRSDLVSVAYNWTQHMAANNSLEHNPRLTSQVKNWQSVGENVGVGPTVKDIEDAFMNSAHHRENILDPGYTEVGIATVRDSRGQLWVTQDFRQPMHTSTASTPRTTTTTTTTAPRHRASAPRTVVHAPASARSSLASRLAQISRTGSAQGAGDPVAKALKYVSTMAALTG